MSLFSFTDPVREVLMNADTISILLTLLDSRTNSSKSSTPIYVVGSWAVASSEMREDWETRIQMGSMILTWAVNILEDLLSGGKSRTIRRKNISDSFSLSN